jgi:hypothetical protein
MTRFTDTASPEDPQSNAQEAPQGAADAGRRTVLGGLAALTLGAASAGCDDGQATKTKYHWEEEVELIDKRVIVVRQGRGSSSMYDGQSVVTQPTLGSLKFTLPEIQAKPIEWKDRFQPLILNVHQGAVYVAGSPWIGRHFSEFGRPRSGWVVQKYNPASQAWDRVPASQMPEPIRNTNLVIDRVPPPEMPRLTLQVKASKDFNGRSEAKTPASPTPIEIHPDRLRLDPNRKSRYAQGTDDQYLTD